MGQSRCCRGVYDARRGGARCLHSDNQSPRIIGRAYRIQPVGYDLGWLTPAAGPCNYGYAVRRAGSRQMGVHAANAGVKCHGGHPRLLPHRRDFEDGGRGEPRDGPAGNGERRPAPIPSPGLASQCRAAGQCCVRAHPGHRRAGFNGMGASGHLCRGHGGLCRRNRKRSSPGLNPPARLVFSNRNGRPGVAVT